MKLFKPKNELIYSEIESNFCTVETPLGRIDFFLEINNVIQSPIKYYILPNGGRLLYFESDIYECEAIICRPKLKLPSNMSVMDCFGIVFRLYSKGKISSSKFRAQWNKEYHWSDVGPASGQHLEAQVFTNENFQVHLGTEAGDALMHRKIKNDMVPRSLNLVGDEEIHTFVQYLHNGLEVPFQNIQTEEKVQVHFISAWDKEMIMILLHGLL